VLHEQAMLPEDCEYILSISKEEHIPLIIDSGDEEVTFTQDALSLKALGLFSGPITEEEADRFHDRLIGHPSIITHKVHSWTPGMHQILFSHTAATKQYGIYEVANILNIDPSEIIGVGDGGNDFPLLMACGLKIAMGNASDDLKAIADYVAPSVEEDGLAHVIEKFILNS
jgi:hydroxymethylpyrimidine pyrophosphatase-like HAD family hydrolase